jgi:hypothetical protein
MKQKAALRINCLDITEGILGVHPITRMDAGYQCGSYEGLPGCKQYLRYLENK